jgi:hypothetical protein
MSQVSVCSAQAQSAAVHSLPEGDAAVPAGELVPGAAGALGSDWLVGAAAAGPSGEIAGVNAMFPSAAVVPPAGADDPGCAATVSWTQATACSTA